jgi:hypothetical protein
MRMVAGSDAKWLKGLRRNSWIACHFAVAVLSFGCAVRRVGVAPIAPNPSWIDLRPGMVVEVEPPQRGAEIVKYTVQPDGSLGRAGNLRWRYHRLFYQVVMNRTGAIRPAVLLGAGSVGELDRLTRQFVEGRLTCGSGSSHCTAFPQNFTTSVTSD